VVRNGMAAGGIPLIQQLRVGGYLLKQRLLGRERYPLHAVAAIELAPGIIAALIEHLVPLPDCKGATP